MATLRRYKIEGYTYLDVHNLGSYFLFNLSNSHAALLDKKSGRSKIISRIKDPVRPWRQMLSLNFLKQLFPMDFPYRIDFSLLILGLPLLFRNRYCFQHVYQEAFG